MVDNPDIQTVEVTSSDEIDMEFKAKTAAEVLTRHYPNHLWAVGWAPKGVLVVKNLAISSHYGFTIDCASSFSATDLAHLVVMAGGELLERAGMARGAWDGQMATTLEGSERRFFDPGVNQ